MDKSQEQQLIQLAHTNDKLTKKVGVKQTRIEDLEEAMEIRRIITKDMIDHLIKIKVVKSKWSAELVEKINIVAQHYGSNGKYVIENKKIVVVPNEGAK